MVHSYFFPLSISFQLQLDLGTPCNVHGNDLPKDTLPPPLDPNSNLPPQGDWTPYNIRQEFEATDLLFTYEQVSVKSLDELFNIWEASLAPFNTPPPFTSSTDMYKTIDSTPYGDVHWENFVIHYNVDKDPSSNKAPPTWKTAQYEGWFHDP